MPYTIMKNAEFFTAALSQKYVFALKIGPDGMYSRVGAGLVQMFSDEYVRLKNFDGSVVLYSRSDTKFQH
ncbi:MULTISPECIES: hypothetical protein [Paenibacillus]|uniref:Uncharacterized protein n=2 Tax=Paenibacillus TaxID=44249 RepID=A0A6M1PIB8_9BACL|nr:MULTISPECIES: hypothetical protein [Paenibacillus]AHV98301.1 hypothetical protein PSAB_16995 [Paenibacillus sabinae T27]NGM81693.1 hypothetical protein [Paenibacillus apii]NJJ41528.1 hypothetical protein [Paenibacillus apii]BCG60155.1 hypothetical protein PUR_35800 [Paenibacillus sp. URB8-2]